MIFSTHPLHPAVEAALRGLGRFVVASAPTPVAILGESAGAEFVVVRAPIPPEVIRRETGLRALVRHGAGMDMIPVEVATECGVLCANVPGVNAVTVAEHVIWTALALLRRFPEVNAGLRGAGWEAGRAFSDTGRELSGRTLGIVGLGNVGRALARIAAAGFGMRVLAVTSRPDAAPEGVEPLPLADVLAQADVLALCCPLTPATRGLIGAAELAALRPGAILVNVARGPVVVEDALLPALRSGHLGGAALDVFDRQPLDPAHPFLTLPNVILTPHMAGITEESMRRMGEGVMAEVRRVLAGDLPRNLVNPEAVARYRQRFA